MKRNGPMLRTLRRIATPCGRSTGQALAFVVIMVPVLVGMSGLAVDTGNVYVNKTSMQRTADAAALAGAQTVLASSSQGTTDARTYANNNGVPDPTIVVTTTIRPHDTIRVTAPKNVKTYFLALLGQTSYTVTATAKAQVGVAVSVFASAIPWAMNDGELQNYGYDEVAVIHPSNSPVNGVTFQAITPPCPVSPCQTYDNAMANNISAPMAISTNYATSNADYSAFSVATCAALNARITAGLGETYNTFSSSSPRVLLFGVYAGNQPNAPAPIKFTTFHAFFLESVTCAPSPSKVTGRFVKLNVPGGTWGSASVLDAGVHVIRLVE